MKRRLSFKAEDRPMKDVLFANDVRFRIPRYQRPYAWSDDDVEEFWNDLIQDDTLFIGSMIFNYEHRDDEGFIDVIDGQQRLLSITILEAVLRDVAVSYDQDLSKLIHDFDIALRDRNGKVDYRVRCGDTTRPFFETYIQKGGQNIQESKPSTTEDRRIRENYLFFLDRVSALLRVHSSDDKRSAALRDIRRRLEELIVIHVRIDSEEEAYEIFETTNARGVDLSVADLVKNLVFKKIRTGNDKDEAKEKWDQIRDNIQDTGIELKRFIRYYWISKHRACPEKRLFRAIKNQTTDWQRFLDDLHGDSEIFNDLYECNESDWVIGKKVHIETYRSLLAIRRMNFTISYIFLVRLFSAFDRLELDPRKTVKAIESFTFIYSAISRQPINKCEKVYSSHASQLHLAVQTAESTARRVAVEKVLSSLRNELYRLLPPFEVFKEPFLAVAYKKNSIQARMLVRYILDALNAHMTSTNEVQIDPYNVNIEHVLPQKPEDGWGLPTKAVTGYVNLLGNLTLVDKRINSQAGNEGLAQKLAILDKSQLPITRKLVADIRAFGKTWGEAEIGHRQGEMANLAYYHVWRIPMPNQ